MEQSFETENDRRQCFKEFVSNVLYNEFDKCKGLAPHHILPPLCILSGLSKLGLQLTTYPPSTVNLTSTWPHFLANACPGLSSLKATRDPAGMEVHGSSLDEMGFNIWLGRAGWHRNGNMHIAFHWLCLLGWFAWLHLWALQDVYLEKSFVDAIMNTSIPSWVLISRVANCSTDYVSTFLLTAKCLGLGCWHPTWDGSQVSTLKWHCAF
jgi:hypothetical protein